MTSTYNTPAEQGIRAAKAEAREVERMADLIERRNAVNAAFCERRDSNAKLFVAKERAIRDDKSLTDAQLEKKLARLDKWYLKRVILNSEWYQTAWNALWDEMTSHPDFDMDYFIAITRTL